MHVGTRRVFISPATYNPDGRWVQQQARNVLMWLEENHLPAEFILHDRDTKFSFAFDRLLFDSGIRRIRTPLLAPDANAFAESWIGSLKRECLNHFMCFSLGHLDHVVQAFVRFHNEFRPHQGLGNRTLPEAATGPPQEWSVNADPELGRVGCQRWVGGLLRHYHRDAA